MAKRNQFLRRSGIMHRTRNPFCNSNWFYQFYPGNHRLCQFDRFSFVSTSG